MCKRPTQIDRGEGEGLESRLSTSVQRSSLVAKIGSVEVLHVCQYLHVATQVHVHVYTLYVHVYICICVDPPRQLNRL